MTGKRNLKFKYLYRDEDNYKIYGSIYIKNNNRISVENANREITKRLIDGEYFYPQIVGIKLFSEHLNPLFDFNGWYEFQEISESNEDAHSDFVLDDFLKRLNPS